MLIWDSSCWAISSALISSMSSSMCGVFLSLLRASLAWCSCPVKAQYFIRTNCSPQTFCDEKITGRLRAYWEQEELEDGGEDSNAQEVGPALVSAEEIVHPQDLPSQQPHRDGQLVDGAQAAPQVERSNLRYVHRHQTRV